MSNYIICERHPAKMRIDSLVCGCRCPDREFCKERLAHEKELTMKREKHLFDSLRVDQPKIFDVWYLNND